MTNLIRFTLNIVISFLMLSPLTAQQGFILDTFPWLEEIIDIEDCAGTSIKVYVSGTTSYVFVSDTNGSVMYNASGDLYCTSYPGFDCLTFYGFETLGLQWDCTTMGHENNPDLFDDYPWLTSFVNPDQCAGENVTVYSSGSYDYLVIETANSTILYNEQGLQYCISNDDLDCLSFYGLSATNENWSCEDNNSGTGCDNWNLSDLTWVEGFGGATGCEYKYVLYSGCLDNEPVFLWQSAGSVADLYQSYLDLDGNEICGEHPNGPLDARCPDFWPVDWDFDNPVYNPSDCEQLTGSVCGTDGNTYQSECQALCNGIQIAHMGRCPCECDDTYQPVCTYAGTYNNACEAECANQMVIYQGECIECPMVTLDEIPWVLDIIVDDIYCECNYEVLHGCFNYYEPYVVLWPRFDTPCVDPALYYYTLDGELICTEMGSTSNCEINDGFSLYPDPPLWKCE